MARPNAHISGNGYRTEAARLGERPQVDRQYMAAVKTFEDAVRLLQKRSFSRARDLFKKVAEVPFLEISGRAQIHARLCERRLNHQGRLPRGAEEYYDLGVAALNARQLDQAIAQLSKSDRLRPNRDHVRYALAAAHALGDNPEVALSHLKAAIELRAGNRGLARQDEDFLLLEKDPRFRQLVGTEVPIALSLRFCSSMAEKNMPGMRVVCIGGGTGLSALLRGLKHHLASPGTTPRRPVISRLTAVVTVTDEGGSSGRLRRELRDVAAGRHSQLHWWRWRRMNNFSPSFSITASRAGAACRATTLATCSSPRSPTLPTTSPRRYAFRAKCWLFAARFSPLPSRTSALRHGASTASIVQGERNITRTRLSIARLFSEPSACLPLPETLEAIRHADLITLGPGSLYTSLVPNLLVKGIPSAIGHSHALKVYVANLMTQPGESRGYSAADHLNALLLHAGRQLFDHIILNTRPLSAVLRRRYERDGAEPVANDLERVRALGVNPIGRVLLVEDHFARHNSAQLAQVILKLAPRQRRRTL